MGFEERARLIGAAVMVPSVLEDLSKRRIAVNTPVNATHITVDIGPIGSLLFLKTAEVTPTGRAVFRQVDPRQAPLTGN